MGGLTCTTHLPREASTLTSENGRQDIAGHPGIPNTLSGVQQLLEAEREAVRTTLDHCECCAYSILSGATSAPALYEITLACGDTISSTRCPKIGAYRRCMFCESKKRVTAVMLP